MSLATLGANRRSKHTQPDVLTEVANREEYLVSVDEHQVAFLQLHGGFHGEDLDLLDGRAIDWPEKRLSAGGRRNPFSNATNRDIGLVTRYLS